MAKQEFKATAKLFVDTTDAKSDAQQFFADIRKHMNDLEKDANKLKVFQSLSEYIAQVDRNLSALKANNPNFDKMFDGLDERLRKSMEDALSYAKDVMSEVGGLTDQLDQAQSTRTQLESAMKGVAKYKKDGTSDDIVKTREAAEQLLDTYKRLNSEINDPTADKKSLEYQKKRVEYIKVATRLAASTNVDSDKRGYSLSRDKMDEFKNAGEDANDYVSKITKTLSNSINTALDKVVRSVESQIARIKLDPSMLSAPHIDSAEKTFYSYSKLKAKLEEYKMLANETLNPDLDSSEIDELYAKMEKVTEELYEIRELSSKESQGLSGIFDALQDGEIEVEEAINNISNLIGIDFSKGIDGAFDQVNKHAVDTAEYIQGITAQLRSMFDVLSQPLDVEYKVLINGQDINIKKGIDSQVPVQTIAETYLSNLDRDAIVSAHSHMGSAPGLNGQDLENIMKDFYFGTAKIGATIGGDSINTWNLAGVAMEDVAKAIKEIEKYGTDLNVEQINAIFKAINPAYTDVARKWKPTDFEGLAKYIYDIGQQSATALAPVERFQNVLKYFAKGIDLSKYQNLLANFKEENAGSIFNQIMKAEGKDLQVGDISKGSLGDVIKDVQRQKDEMFKLRREAQLTYEEIEKISKEYYNSQGKSNVDFFKKYFHASELPNINEMFMDIDFGQRDLTGVTKTLASYFNIDTDDIPDDEIRQTSAQAIDETSQKLREQEQLWENVRVAIKNGIGEAVGLDRTAETLEVIEREIKEGILTSLEECIARFKEFNYITDDYSLDLVGRRQRVIDESELEGVEHVGIDEEVVDKKELARKEERIAELESDLRASDDALQETLGNKYALIAESRTLEIEKAKLLLQKQNLEYEDILALMQSYQSLQAKAKEAFDYGDEKAMYDMQDLAGQIYDRVVPQNLDDFTEPDRWFKAVGVSAEEGAQKLLEFRERLDAIRSSRDDLDVSDSEDIGDLQRENGALEDRLELLREIASLYGTQITQRDRNTYERLVDKDNESGLSPKDEDRMSELSDKIDEADNNLLEFEQTYERIVLKLSNGKKLEILPNDKGLRDLYEIADSYGTEYKGFEIDDIEFVRQEQFLKTKIESYEELCKVVARYNELIFKGSSRTSKEKLELDAIQERIDATKGYRTPEQAVDDSIVWSRMIGPLGDLKSEKLAAYLGIEIPSAAGRAEDAIKGAAGSVELFEKTVADADLSSNLSDTAADGDAGNLHATSSNETEILDILKQKLDEVRQAVDAKTAAFENETVVVDAVVDAEVAKLNELSDKLTEVKSKMDLANDSDTLAKEQTSQLDPVEQPISNPELDVFEAYNNELDEAFRNTNEYKECFSSLVQAINSGAITAEKAIKRLGDAYSEWTLDQFGGFDANENTTQNITADKTNPLIANAFKGMNLKEFIKKSVNKDAEKQLEDEFYKLAQTFVNEDSESMALQISNIANFIIENSKKIRERKEENIYDEAFKALQIAYTEDDVAAMVPQLLERTKSILGRKFQKLSDKNKHFYRIDQAMHILANNYPSLFDDPNGSESDYNKLDQLLDSFDAWKREGARKTRDITLDENDTQSIIDYIYGEMLAPMMANIDEQREIATRTVSSEIGQMSIGGFSEESNSKGATSQTALSEEIAQLEKLRKKINAVKAAVVEKTDAFNAEKDAVGTAVDGEIAALNRLIETLQQVAEQVVYIASGLSYIDSHDIQTPKDDSVWGEDGAQTDINYQQHVGAQTDEITKDYALEGTLQTTNGILNEISAKINQEQDFSDLINPLKSAVSELQNVANGIVQHRKTQKSDTSVAQAKLQDRAKQQLIAGIAKDSVASLGNQAEIDSMQALANGIVKVEGAFKNANGQWEGFTVKVNEANQAVDLAIKKHSAFATALQKAEDVDENTYHYSKEEVEAKARKHLDEYAAQGKKATVQFKDSGRYTITILEEIDGLTKQIFQTFDENDNKIERTTVTMSNAQKEKLEALQKKLIDDGADKGLVNANDEEYNKYLEAKKKLKKLNEDNAQKDSLTDDEIADWKQQILLVEQLGAEVEKLIVKRKEAKKLSNTDTAKTKPVFDTKQLQAYSNDVEKVMRGLDFGINDKGLTSKQKAIIDGYKEMIELLAVAKNSNEELTDAQRIAFDVKLAGLKDKTKAYNDDIVRQKEEKARKNAPKEKFKADYDAQLDAFDKYEESLSGAGYLTAELTNRIEGLKAKLISIDSSASLDAWQKEFKELTHDIDITKAQVEGYSSAQLKVLRGKANSSIKGLGFDIADNNLDTKQKEIQEAYRKALAAINEYQANVKAGNEAEVSGINEAITALKEKAALYKKQHDISNVNPKNFGATVARREDTRYDRLNKLATDADSGYSSSNEFMKSFNQYKTAYNQLISKQKEFASLDSLTNAQVAEFDKLKDSCFKAGNEIEKIVRASEKLANGQDVIKIDPLGEDFVNTATNRKNALRDFVKQHHDISEAVIQFDKNYTKCIYTVENSDGTFTKTTAQLDAFKHRIVETAGATEASITSFSRFVNEIKNKIRTISAYLISITGIEEIFQQIRQGIGYIKEIDTALTELKKVTNATDAEYDTFLQSMSRTASVVGSTVAELTTMSAEWARLGYTMQESAKLAESTAILLNVSEFENATDASQALISTMQAFSYTADESQHVVDILNEVGEFIAHR